MKRNKFNVGTSKKSKKDRTVDSIVFMSKKEAQRYIELKKLEKKGLIKDLEVQPRFVLQTAFIDNENNKHRKIEYVADFRYYDKNLKAVIVEDVKGMRTDIYKIKKKLLLYYYNDFLFRET